MGVKLGLVVAWTLLGAMIVVVHVWLVVHCLRFAEAGRRRVLALIPVFTPFVAWSSGARRGTILWGVVVGTYVVLRLLGPWFAE